MAESEEQNTEEQNTAEQARVAEVAKEVLERFLELLELPSSVSFTGGYFVRGGKEMNESAALNIEGDDLGILIGRRGQTLASLQYLVRLIVAQKTGSELPIIIDVEHYRQRRCDSLRNLAQRVAEQVRTKRVPFALEPMSSFDRRVIHLALLDHLDVTTRSTGMGEMRKVVVMPLNWEGQS